MIDSAGAIPMRALRSTWRRCNGSGDLRMNAVIRGVATLILTAILLQFVACRNYVPPESGLPSRQNWLEGGGG
jgi:hypothetical protein